MNTLLLNFPAGRQPRAFSDWKTACHSRIHLPVGKHTSGETGIVHQQATGAKNQKNSEQNAHYLLTILVTQELWARGASHRTPSMGH